MSPVIEQTIASEIEQLQREANMSSAHEAFVFHQGYNAAMRDMQAAKDQGINYAHQAGVIYLTVLEKYLPERPTVSQARAGIPSACPEPTVLVIVDSESESYLEELREFARLVEAAMWDAHGVLVSIWTIQNSHLDTDLIEHDFPWVHEQVHAA